MVEAPVPGAPGGEVAQADHPGRLVVGDLEVLEEGEHVAQVEAAVEAQDHAALARLDDRPCLLDHGVAADGQSVVPAGAEEAAGRARVAGRATLHFRAVQYTCEATTSTAPSLSTAAMASLSAAVVGS